MRKVFFDNSDRLRSGWRALVFFFAFSLIAFALIGLSLVVLAQIPIAESSGAPLRLTIPFGISASVALIVGWLCARNFDRVPFRSLGASLTKGWFRHLIIGCGIGAGTFLIALLISTLAGGITISLNRISSGRDISATLLSTLIVFAVGAASEETLFRGYLLQTFLRSDHAAFGVALTAFLFASAHGGNPGVNALAWANTLLAGIWFAVAYLRTRDLWLPFGVHLAWNWLQGPVFGISVSGISGFASDPLFRAADVGPAWLTGGEYGIEGGVACFVALALSTAVIWMMPAIRPDEEVLAFTSPIRPGS